MEEGKQPSVEETKAASEEDVVKSQEGDAVVVEKKGNDDDGDDVEAKGTDDGDDEDEEGDDDGKAVADEKSDDGDDGDAGDDADGDGDDAEAAKDGDAEGVAHKGTISSIEVDRDQVQSAQTGAVRGKGQLKDTPSHPLWLPQWYDDVKLVDLKQQSVEVGEAHEHESRARRDATFSGSLVKTIDDNVRTPFDVLKRSAVLYADKPCLGTLRTPGCIPPPIKPISTSDGEGEGEQADEGTPSHDPAAPGKGKGEANAAKKKKGKGGKTPPKAYVWETFSEVRATALHFGAGLRTFGLKKGSRVGVYARNRREWTLALHGGYSQSMVNVAIYDTFGADKYAYVVNHSEIEALVCDPVKLPRVLEAFAETPNVRLVVVTEGDDESVSDDQLISDEVRSAFAAHGCECVTFRHVVAVGMSHDEFPCVPPMPDDLATIMYTSGTSGTPKGVMLKHSSVVATASSALVRVKTDKGLVSSTDRLISYLPLAHILERMLELGSCLCGAAVGFYSGNILNLTEDIAALKPTLLPGVPRVFDKIRKGVEAQVLSSGKMKQKIFGRALAKARAGHKPLVYKALVFKKMKKRLGGHVRLIVSGGAPLTPQTQEFIQLCFDAPVIQGYALTETAAAGCIQHPMHPGSSGVGPPVPSVEVKLRDVPELNYTQEENGSGEICIRGPSLFMGYYKDEAQTAEVLSEDGWFRTGDVGVWNEDGTLRIIDRVKNFFKLAQGEYISSEKLEGVYTSSALVNQIWIYGDSTKTHLIAAVVPAAAGVASWQRSTGQTTSSDWLTVCNSLELRKAIDASLAEVHKGSDLNSLERVKGVIVMPFEMNADNALTTPTMKLRRKVLKETLEEQIKAVYELVEAETYNDYVVEAPEYASKAQLEDLERQRQQQQQQQQGSKKGNKSSSAKGKGEAAATAEGADASDGDAAGADADADADAEGADGGDGEAAKGDAGAPEGAADGEGNGTKALAPYAESKGIEVHSKDHLSDVKSPVDVTLPANVDESVFE